MPTPPADLLLPLVGLSAAGSPCFPLTALPTADVTAIATSSTGIYLDTVEGLLREPTQGQATAADYYARLGKARANAVEAVLSELLRRAPIGSPRFTGRSGALTLLGNGVAIGGPAILTLYTRPVEAAAWRISDLRLYATATVIDVPVLLDGLPVGTVTTNGGAFVPTAGPLVLTLDGRTHRLTATLPDGVSPVVSTLSCGTCSEWGKYVTSCLTNIPNGTAAPGRVSSGGFVLQIREQCTELLDPVRFALSQEADLARPLAHAIRYTAAALFVVDLITDSNRSRYTLLEPKLLPDMQKLYQDKAEQWLAWLAGPEGIARIAHPCYVCRSPAWQGSIAKNY